MRRAWIAGVLLVVGWVGVGTAQTVIDLNDAKFYWEWIQDTGGPAIQFRIKCGPSVGTYPTVVGVSPTLRTFPVSQVVTGSGSYHCIITAVNSYGESPSSADLFFAAGVTPLSPSNFRVAP